jgi:hypothetical protein
MILTDIRWTRERLRWQRDLKVENETWRSIHKDLIDKIWEAEERARMPEKRVERTKEKLKEALRERRKPDSYAAAL